MKKLAIAGASVALAAMPIVSTFAVMNVTDHLKVTVSESCELGDTTPAAGASAVENYWYASVNPGDSATDFVAGTASTTTGGQATSIEINCNVAEGYTLTPTFNPLVWEGGDSTQDITYGGAATPAAGTYTAYYALNDAAPTNFASATAIERGPSMTDTFVFSYKVTPTADQAAGDYEGTATYVLAEAQ